ncbi:MAG: hypothetical protein WC249_00115 [Patescibacteria group bacterium]|jgi:hypothetical protein
MKNAVYFLVVVFLGLSFVGCTGGSLSVGDKNSSEVKESRNFFLDRISYYKDEISDLKNENLFLEQSNDTSSVGKAKHNQMIIANDLEIDKYQQKISLAEDRLDEFVEKSAGKADRTSINLYGGEPLEMAEAYATIRYADNTSGYQNAASTVSSKGLVGVVENAGNLREVVVKIIGPAAFYREFTLTARKKSPTFNIPMPGNYTATFFNRSEIRVVTKKVGPNIVYYDDEGKAYDFKATLLP